MEFPRLLKGARSHQRLLKPLETTIIPVLKHSFDSSPLGVQIDIDEYDCSLKPDRRPTNTVSDGQTLLS